jgi:hypothetical protein
MAAQKTTPSPASSAYPAQRTRLGVRSPATPRRITLLVAGGASLIRRVRKSWSLRGAHRLWDRPAHRGSPRPAGRIAGQEIAANVRRPHDVQVTIAAHAEAAIAWMAQLWPRAPSRRRSTSSALPSCWSLARRRGATVGFTRCTSIRGCGGPWKRLWPGATDRDYYPYRSLRAYFRTCSFIDRYYVPANLTLVVTGGISSAAAWRRWRSFARCIPSS